MSEKPYNQDQDSYSQKLWGQRGPDRLANEPEPVPDGGADEGYTMEDVKHRLEGRPESTV